MFTHEENTFVITRDVIVKALKLPEGLSTNILYTKNEIKAFLVQIWVHWRYAKNGSIVKDQVEKRIEFLF